MDVMSLINQQIAAAQRAIPSRRQGAAEKEDPLAKENRAAYRKLLESALAEGNTAQLDALFPQAVASGIDPTPYRVAAGKPAMDQRLSQAINETVAQRLGVAPKQTTTRDEAVGPAVDYGETEPTKQATTPDALKQQLNELFTPEFTTRMLAKKILGVDVGAHYGQESDWYQQYQEMRQANPNLPASKIVEAVTMQNGWMPDSAANLKDLSPDEKETMANTVFGNHFNDPVLRSSINKAFPNQDIDKTMAGFVLHGMRQQGYTIPSQYQQFLDRFDQLSDDMQEMENARQRNEIITKGVAQEEVDAKVWGGKLNRIAEEAQVRHEINKPRLTSDTLKEVKGGRTINDIAGNTMGIVEAFYSGGGLDAIPTGVGEMWRKYMDKYGVGAEKDRIRLRAALNHFTQSIYDTRGKQISNVELDLAMQMIPTMDDAPMQFVTKFSEFQKAYKVGVKNTIDTWKKAGYDVGDVEAFYSVLEGQPTLEEVLERQGYNKPSTPKPKVEAEPQIIQSDPDDDANYIKDHIYEDATGQRAKYLGGGKWQLLSPSKR
jgi:hypothetical protein